MSFWVAGATVVVGGIAAHEQGKAADNAADAQAGASNAANQQQWQMFQQNRNDQEPFRQAGLTGLSEYMSMLGLPTAGVAGGGMPGYSDSAAQAYLKSNPDVAADAGFGNNPQAAWRHYMQYGRNEGRAWAAPAAAGTPQQANTQTQADAFAKFRATPGYQFGLDEGSKSVQASAAARGGLNSGATLKSLMKFGRDYSDQQGYTPYMNKLASLAGIGQTATNQIGSYGQNAVNQMGANTINAGQARAQGIYDKANAWSNFGNTVTGAMGRAWGNVGWGGV